MSFDPLSAAFDLGKEALVRLWPDPVQRAEQLLELEKLKQEGDFAQLDAHVKVLLAQLNINQAEAKHKSIFVAGWRPSIGWVASFSLAYAGILHPLMLWGWQLLAVFVDIPEGVEPPPYVESAILGTIVTGMLGIGTMRSYDKRSGAETNNIKSNQG